MTQRFSPCAHVVRSVVLNFPYLVWLRLIITTSRMNFNEAAKFRRKKTRLVRSGFNTVSGSELVALTGGSHSTPNTHNVMTLDTDCPVALDTMRQLTEF